MQINLLLHPAFPIFVKDRIRFGKPGPSSRFLSAFTIFVYVETNRQML